MSTSQHKKKLPQNIKIAIVCVSTTRKLSADKSGAWIKKQAEKEGHEVVIHQTVTDDIDAIRELTEHIAQQRNPDVIIMSGGTGISPKDVTIEAVKPLFKKELTAFGALFAILSFEEIDCAAILSRATAGIIQDSAIFCIPGSIKACKLACRELIFPELGHILKHTRE